MSHVTTHVLDTALGRAARGVPVVLEQERATPGGAAWDWVARGETDADGRIGDLGPHTLAHGRYRLRFDSERYFVASGQPCFFPEVVVVFLISEDAHHHVPVLLSPFSFSSYRGT